jgi:hypothetical protein
MRCCACAWQLQYSLENPPFLFSALQGEGLQHMRVEGAPFRKTTAIFFFFSGRWRDLLRGMLLRMRLAVTVLTGKSAILFSALQAEGHQHTRVEEAPFNKDDRHLFFFCSGRCRDLLRGMLLRMRLAVTVVTGKSAILFSALQACKSTI